MAAPINLIAYSDALVVLGTAGIVVPLVRHFGLSPVLGYLGAGAVLGPLGIITLADKESALWWVTISEYANVAGIAELGVVFLMFLIGLELSYERLKSMRRLVFGLGSLQVAISTVVLAFVLARAGLPPQVATVLGACMALSSTAIVLEVLSNQGRMKSSAGRASFSVLLAQDLAVIPILMFISILGAKGSGSIAANVVAALLQAAAAVALIVGLGRLLLRPFLRIVAGTQSAELFMAVILFVIIGSGVVASLAGMSMALGAFVAGLLLAETAYRKTIEATIEPFKGLLLGLFFFTIGMTIDARELAREPLLLLGCVVALVVLKALILIGLGRLYKLSWPAALETGLLLGPGGEFAFVGIGLASASGLLTPRVSGFALAVTSITMVLIPVLAILARRLSPMLAAPKPSDTALALVPAPRKQHAIVVGHGRVGKVVCALLAEHGLDYTATDHDATAVVEDRRRGHEVYYGDAANAAFLDACGLQDATGVIVTIHTRASIDAIVRQVRAMRPDILIVSRARDAEHARHLYAIGVSDAVPETIEASLQLSEAALVGLGVATGPVIASIHEQRDVFRRELQTAADDAGGRATRSVRPKSRSRNV